MAGDCANAAAGAHVPDEDTQLHPLFFEFLDAGDIPAKLAAVARMINKDDQGQEHPLETGTAGAGRHVPGAGHEAGERGRGPSAGVREKTSGDAASLRREPAAQMTGENAMFNIEEELKKLPAQPGVYIMHDAKDEIIYVGKAISLKNRVRQYFQSSRNKTAKIEQMVSRIARFEYIVTDSELEALVLECNLIKEHRPRYNTMLKDDKTYPYIKVTVSEEYPQNSVLAYDEKG